jgi:integrase
MSRSRRTGIPKHCEHKASGRGVVRLDGRDHYTGPWATPEADARYEQLVGEWLANGRSLATPRPPATASPGSGTGGNLRTTGSTPPATIGELILAFWKHAEVYYRHPDGTPTSELANYRQSLRLLRALHQDEPTVEFTPSKLKAIRARWVADGICRPQINLRVGRVKRVFKWGVSEELVPVAVWQALCAVPGLQANRSEAVESAPVRPVSDDQVAAVLSHLRPQVRDMVEVQRLTGMRPGEVCQLRWADVDRSSDVWAYRPARHKTAWRGKDRVVFIGPRAQAVLMRYADRDPGAHLFSPREAVEHLHRERAERRVTKVYPSQSKRQPRRANPKRKPAGRYTVTAYGQAIRRACERAAVVPWHPNQLRHTAGTEIRKAYGVEAAQVVLGHSKADVTQVYAERDHELARRVAKDVG